MSQNVDGISSINYGRDAGDNGVAVAVSSEVMIGAVIFLFFVVVFVFLLYLYARRFLSSEPSMAGGSRATLVFVPGHAEAVARRGLDPTVLKSMPVTVYKSADFTDPLECSVCLCELADGEDARLLPKCNHGFHVDCIDMWFQSHSTCPLCRAPVGPEEQHEASVVVDISSTDPETPPESLVLPTNVLFWGTQGQINTGRREEECSTPPPSSSATSSGVLIIEIPRRVMEGFASPASPLPTSRAAEEMKSPPQVPARMRSFRRLLSRGKRVVGAASSPTTPVRGDMEKGFLAGEGSNALLTPKTPKTPA